MERIFLGKNEKKVFLAYSNCKNPEEYILKILSKRDRDISMDSLVRKGLMNGTDTEDMGYFMCYITDYGREYLNFNPLLENPISEKEEEIKNNKNKWKDRLLTALITIILTEGARFLIDYFLRYESGTDI